MHVRTGICDTIVIDPADPNTLYGSAFNGPTTAIYKSSDAGANWTAISMGITGTEINTIAIDSTRPLTAYAGTYFRSDDNCLFKTTNGGTSWSYVGTGVCDSGLTPATVRQILIDPVTPERVYAVGGGFYLSTNRGGSWALKGYSDSGGGTSIALAGGDALLKAGYQLYRSDDRGDHWRLVTTLLATDLMAVATAPSDRKTVYVGTNTALFMGRYLN